MKDLLANTVLRTCLVGTIVKKKEDKWYKLKLVAPKDKRKKEWILSWPVVSASHVCVALLWLCL